jgi:hypothetical protein
MVTFVCLFAVAWMRYFPQALHPSDADAALPSDDLATSAFGKRYALAGVCIRSTVTPLFSPVAIDSSGPGGPGTSTAVTPPPVYIVLNSSLEQLRWLSALQVSLPVYCLCSWVASM